MKPRRAARPSCSRVGAGRDDSPVSSSLPEPRVALCRRQGGVSAHTWAGVPTRAWAGVPTRAWVGSPTRAWVGSPTRTGLVGLLFAGFCRDPDSDGSRGSRPGLRRGLRPRADGAHRTSSRSASIRAASTARSSTATRSRSASSSASLASISSWASRSSAPRCSGASRTPRRKRARLGLVRGGTRVVRVSLKRKVRRQLWRRGLERVTLTLRIAVVERSGAPYVFRYRVRVRV